MPTRMGGGTRPLGGARLPIHRPRSGRRGMCGRGRAGGAGRHAGGVVHRPVGGLQQHRHRPVHLGADQPAAGLPASARAQSCTAARPSQGYERTCKPPLSSSARCGRSTAKCGGSTAKCGFRCSRTRTGSSRRRRTRFRSCPSPSLCFPLVSSFFLWCPPRRRCVPLLSLKGEEASSPVHRARRAFRFCPTSPMGLLSPSTLRHRSPKSRRPQGCSPRRTIHRPDVMRRCA